MGMSNVSFSDLGLSEAVLKSVQRLGFEQPSPIQAQAIPALLKGGDVVGQSQTGSGKTAAFAIPLIQQFVPGGKSPQSLILCPTRELAAQVANDIHQLAFFQPKLHSVPIYGGASYERQFRELEKGIDILIGTPGRLMDHLERGTLDLSAIRHVVLDEADRMLDMGFRDDIETILSACPEQRQTIFFSATLSREIKELIERFANEPEMIRVKPKEVEAPAIEQWSFEVPPRRKLEALIRLLDFHGFKLGLIFCNTQRMVDELGDTLIAQGFSADRLHGGLSQSQRTRVMNLFKQGGFQFLVATDVAARGIDVDDLEVVVNYDLPYEPEDYVHRIGRTGRAGRRGMAVTLVTGRDLRRLQGIERATHSKVQRGKLPTPQEMEEKRTTLMLEKVRSAVDENNWAAQIPIVETLLEEGIPSIDLAAALLQLLHGDAAPDINSQPKETEESKGPSEKVSLPTPVAGKHWVKVNLGKVDSFTPRDFVNLLAEGLGLDPRTVGKVKLAAAESFAQIPESLARALVENSASIEVGEGEVNLEALPLTAKSRTGGAKKPPGGKRPSAKPRRKGPSFPSKKPFSKPSTGKRRFKRKPGK